MRIAHYLFGTLSVSMAAGVFIVLAAGVLPIVHLSTITGTDANSNPTSYTVMDGGIIWRNVAIALGVSAFAGTALARQAWTALTGLVEWRKRRNDARYDVRQALRRADESTRIP